MSQILTINWPCHTCELGRVINCLCNADKGYIGTTEFPSPLVCQTCQRAGATHVHWILNNQGLSISPIYNRSWFGRRIESLLRTSKIPIFLGSSSSCDGRPFGLMWNREKVWRILHFYETGWRNIWKKKFSRPNFSKFILYVDRFQKGRQDTRFKAVRSIINLSLGMGIHKLLWWVKGRSGGHPNVNDTK